MIQKIDKLRYLQIGVQGENIANDIQIDVSEWVEAYPGASIHLLFKPYNAVAPSPMVITVEDGILIWQPSLGATAVTGVGYTEVRAIDLETGMIKKSRIIPTSVENSVSGVDSEDPPAPFEDWVNNVLQAGEDAVNAKTVATAAKEAAEAARDAAQAAAGDFQGLSAEVETLTPGSDATIDVTHEEGGLYNFAFGIPKGEKGDKGETGDPAPADQVVPAVDDWLDDHITNPSNPPLDTSLSLSNAAAPANLVGELKSAFNFTVGYVNLFDDLIMGSLNTNTGAIQDSYNRCVNQSIRECAEDILCTCESGYQIYVLKYNNDDTVTVLSTWTSSFLLPANTSVRFMVKKTSDAAITVAEAKANVSGETDAISKINVQIDEITQNITEIADRFETVNLFDNEWEAGSLYTNGNETTGNAYRTGFIPVKTKTKYTLQNEVSGASPYLVGLIYEYTASKVFIKRHSDTSVNIYSFETDAATAYIRFRTAENASATETGAKNAKYMLHEGQGYSGYFEYGQFTFNDNFVQNADGDAFAGFNLYCNYFDYAKDARPNDGTTGSRFDANNLTAQDVYDAYDALVSAHTDYVSKTDLGMDESNTYHIYQYKFMPPVSAMINSSTGTAINEPPCMFQKIIITSGTHGDGEGGDKTDSIISVYNLMKALCDNYKGNPALSFIRMNVEVIVIPCVNPWGITNKSRYNSNDVDINRNFDAGWSSSAHSGSSAASEAETQIMQNLFDNNTDAVAHVEVHTRGGNAWAQTSTTFISETLKTSELKYVMQTVTAYLKNKFGATGTVNIDMLDVGMIIDYSKKVGIESTLLECAFMSAQSEPSLHSKETDKRNTEFVADTVIKSLQWFIFHPNLT